MSLYAASNVAVGILFIGCPNCNRKQQVSHLDWSAHICKKCDTIVHNPRDSRGDWK